MKKYFVLGLVLVFVVAATVAFAGILNTKHNLTSSNNRSPQTTHTTNAAATLCGFCHIPHGGNTGVTNAPLWGRELRATATNTYNVYGGGLTLANTPVGQPGTNSLTCLSCHDGTIALGVNLKNGVSTTGYTMTGTYVSGDKLAVVAGLAYQPNIAGTGGNDLTNDHPVGLQYVGTAASNSPAGLVELSVAQNRGFKFYNTDRMECATCHDPHTENTSFKRVITPATGDFCTDCHEKK